MSLPYVMGGAVCVLAALLLNRAGAVEIAPLPVAEFTVDDAPEPEPVGVTEP